MDNKGICLKLRMFWKCLKQEQGMLATESIRIQLFCNEVGIPFSIAVTSRNGSANTVQCYLLNVPCK